MARGRNQKLKLLYLRDILLENTDESHGMTVEEMLHALQRMGVDAERKALYDDLETLRAYGMDIEMRRARDVRYYVVSRDFEMPELKLLVDAVQSSKFITRTKSNELIGKLEGLAGRHQAQRLRRQVYVSNRIKAMNESIYYAVDELHEAIGQNRRITFQYFDWSPKKEKQLRHGGKRYAVSPWALIWDDENYYLIAYDSEEARIKHYRVDKMLSIRMTEQERDGETLFGDFDAALYSQKTFGMYGGEERAVTLQCSNRLAGIMVDRFGTDTVFRTVDESHFEFTVKVAISPLFLSWVVGFGAEVRVISPKDVTEQLCILAGQVLGQYE